MPNPKANLNLKFLKRPLRDRLLYSYVSQFNPKDQKAPMELNQFKPKNPTDSVVKHYINS